MTLSRGEVNCVNRSLRTPSYGQHRRGPPNWDCRCGAGINYPLGSRLLSGYFQAGKAHLRTANNERQLRLLSSWRLGGEGSANPLGQLVGGHSFAQRDDPVRLVFLRGVDVIAVDGKKRSQGDQRRAFVSLEKVLPLGDAVRQHRGLRCQVGILVVSVVLWATQSSAKSGLVSKTVASFLVG